MTGSPPDSLELPWCVKLLKVYKTSIYVVLPKLVHFIKITIFKGRLGGTAVKRLPSAQGVIPAFWDRAPHQAPPL